jgi:hypothetical protein
MAVKNVKILKGVVYAEVTCGSLDNGGWITMNVKVAKGEVPAVAAALAQLDAAIVEIAEGQLGEAANNKELNARVKERLASERKRHAEALEIQRKTLTKGVIEKLRFKARSYLGGPSAIDEEVGRALTAAASSLEGELEKTA